MNKKLTRGFTLIELLVVIAIIGILASVVLASLNTARDKGANAAIKADLNDIRTQAEIVYDNNSPHSYSGLCGNAQVDKGLVGAQNNLPGGTKVIVLATAGAVNQVTCHVLGTNDAWAVSSDLRADEGTSVAWCIDSTGAAKGITAQLGANVTACP